MIRKQQMRMELIMLMLMRMELNQKSMMRRFHINGKMYQNLKRVETVSLLQQKKINQDFYLIRIVLMKKAIISY